MGMIFVAFYHFAVAQAFLEEPLSLRLTRFLILAAYGFVLVVIAFIDLDHRLILDRITYPAIPAFYGLGLLLPENDWRQGLIGAAVGYLVVRLIADGYYFLSKREGLGYGDGKLLAIVGALFGWQGVVVTLFGGSILGSVIGTAVLVVVRRRDQRGESPPNLATVADPEAGAEDSSEAAAEGTAEAEMPPLRHAEVPFGPFLVVGALAYVFVQPWLRFSFALLWGTGGCGM